MRQLNHPPARHTAVKTAPTPELPLPLQADLPASCDVLVVGGSINGAGIARDLAGRGLSVVLCEKDDLASHTSSSKTKLIHGRLRYLEYYEFALVRKALAEREVLLKSAPHIMWPLRFVMPHDQSMRPVWMVRAGLFLYDHLAEREVLAGLRTIDLRTHAAGAPLKKVFRKGFVYSDGWVDDARLVVLNALAAAEVGATVLTRWACVDARREPTHWRQTLHSTSDATRQISALRAGAAAKAFRPAGHPGTAPGARLRRPGRDAARRRGARRRGRPGPVRGRTELPALCRVGRSADNVLWRRTKLGLHYDAAQRGSVAAWCESHWAPPTAPAVPPKPRETSWT